MDIDGWLRGIGLAQYGEIFHANDIDGELLGRLTNDDLKDIGVSSLGHRKKLLEAIAALAAAPDAAPATPVAAPEAKTPDGAERRHLAVLFCDLVGSTSMSAALDAEDWRDLVGGYLDAACEAVAQMGGHVAKKLGDGIMALFGHPIAQENDAERAVRAALAIQLALAELNRKNLGSVRPELVARIGIAAGAVVVDSSGEIFGDAPNIAARVQALAEPGTVLVTARVQRQVAGLFVVEDRGAHALKGVAEPTALFRIARASGGGRRSGQRALTPLVGRDEEVTMLLRRWERARQGEGQFVTIVGEPGLGKSRLIEEFHARLRETPHSWTEWSSSQLLQNTPLHPIADWGRQRFGGADVAPERRLADLETSLSQVKLDPTEYVPLLAPLVDIPLPPERASALAPEELRRRQMAAILAWFAAGARTQPIVLAFEDLHWADPTTLDLMRGFAERGALAPLLVVATARPEFHAPWGARSHHGTITLAPLDRAQVRQMVGALAERHALTSEVIEGVGERTGGVPLFIEEVTRLLLERGEQGGAQAIPPTLQQSLAARLDRLGPAREVALIGAVIGRGFSYPLLRAVTGTEDAPLQRALEKLVEADILLVEGLPPDAEYRFKHALIQDAAYENLLKSRRQALHRCVAETLRDAFPDRADAEPEALAHHFTQAGLNDAAIEYWGRAGDQALRRSAFQEAIAHLGKAIEMADKGGGGQAGVSGQRQQLHVAYGNALIATRGYGAPETTAAFAKARESARGEKDAPERLAADYGLWVGSFTRGELAAMRAHAAACLRDVEAKPDSPEAGVAHRVCAQTHWFAGEYVEARDHLERALALFRPGRDDDLAFRFGHDAGAGAMAYLAPTSWALGDVARAIALVDAMLTRIASLTHVGTLAFGRLHAAMFELIRGDLSRAAQHAVELARLAREHDLPMFRALGVFLQGLATVESGAPGDGLDDMRRGIELLREQNVLVFDGLFKIALAEAEALASDVDRAIAILDEALATSERTGHRAYDADLHRIHGDILLRADPENPARAEDAYRAAVAVAREQGARSFGLQAALKLAKLYQSTGRPVEAHDALAPALEGFSPTPELPEIAEAPGLLAALAETGELKKAAASRQRRLQLQTGYGKAVMLSRGFGSEEAKAAFARARELATGVDNAAERFDAYYGLFVGSLVRGELRSARETAETFLREAEKEERTTEAAAARRCLGLACLFQGDLAVARAHFEQALRIFDPERDREAKFRFGMDTGAAATGYLALTNWLLGEAGPARKLIEEAIARAVESAHVPTQAQVYWWKALFDVFRDDAQAARRAADSVLEVSRGHGLGLYLAIGALPSGWARARLGDRVTGMTELRQTLAAYADQGNKLFAPFFQGRLAEFEAEGQDAEGALARIDEALALASRPPAAVSWRDDIDSVASHRQRDVRGGPADDQGRIAQQVVVGHHVAAHGFKGAGTLQQGGRRIELNAHQ